MFPNNDPRHPDLIPELILKSIDAYALEGRPVGSFLEAVLSHELFEAVAYADEYSMRGLCAIVCYIHNEVPANCHGSRRIYELWLSLHEVLRRQGDVEDIVGDLEYAKRESVNRWMNRE